MRGSSVINKKYINITVITFKCPRLRTKRGGYHRPKNRNTVTHLADSVVIINDIAESYYTGSYNNLDLEKFSDAAIISVVRFYKIRDLFTPGELAVIDDVRQYSVFNFILNNLDRVENDAWMYANPNEYMKIVKNGIPAMTLFSDIGNWLSALQKAFDGDENNDTFRSGPAKGDSRAWDKFWRLWPGTAQYPKHKRLLRETRNRKLFEDDWFEDED